MKNKKQLNLEQYPQPKRLFNWTSVYTIQEDKNKLRIRVELPFLRKYFSLGPILFTGIAILFLIYFGYTIIHFSTLDHPFTELFASLVACLGFGFAAYKWLSDQLDVITVEVSAQKLIRTQEPLIRSQKEWDTTAILEIKSSEYEEGHTLSVILDDEKNSFSLLFTVQTQEEAEWFCAKIWSVLHS